MEELHIKPEMAALLPFIVSRRLPECDGMPGFPRQQERPSFLKDRLLLVGSYFLRSADGDVRVLKLSQGIRKDTISAQAVDAGDV